MAIHRFGRLGIKTEPSGETYRRFTECTMSRILSGSQAEKDFSKNFWACAAMFGVPVTEADALVERKLFASDGHIGTSVSIAKAILGDAIKKHEDRVPQAR